MEQTLKVQEIVNSSADNFISGYINKTLTILKPEDLIASEEIFSRQFSNFTKLESVELPDNISVINDYAFKGCSSLKTVLINNSSRFYSDILDGCNKIETIKVPFVGFREPSINDTSIIEFGRIFGSSYDVSFNENVPASLKNVYVGRNINTTFSIQRLI